MSKQPTNIDTAQYEVGQSTREGEADFRFLDISGEHIGVKIEELPKGGTSSHHHYHTAEEEHVIVLDGSATLHLGEENIELTKGDHICFPAGEAVAHHIENTSDLPFKFLVFGERKQDDVVFYPNGSALLVKSSAGFQVYNYEARKTDR